MISTNLTTNYLGVALPQSPDSTNTVSGNSPGQTLTGKKGVNNAIFSDGGGSTLIGGGANDTFFVLDPGDQVVVPATGGIDTVISWTSFYQLPANVENLILQSASDGVGVGNSMDNLMVAQGSSNYTLDGGAGNDVLIGNGSGDPLDTGGTTTFIIEKGNGNDVIANFTNGDVVQLMDYSNFTSLATVKAAMTQVGSDVVLNLGGGETLTFRNETIGAFKASDFRLSALLPNMTLRFNADFNNFTSSPDGSVGWMTTGGAGWRTLSGNNEAEYYSDSSVGVNPFSVSNGVLTITASKGSNPQGLPYNSGIITTEGSFGAEYGLWEITAKLPSGAGLWPAMWLLPTSLDWPPEIDIMEGLQNDPSDVYMSLHSGPNNDSVTNKVYVGDTTQSFNTYAVDWEPTTITWYYNGVAVASAPTPADMHQPMYLLINLAVGGNGSWPGAPTSAAEFPAQMQISGVQFYASSNTTAVTGTQVLAAGTPVTIQGDTPSSGPVVNPPVTPPPVVTPPVVTPPVVTPPVTPPSDPVTSVTMSPGTGALKAGAKVTITVNFSGPVTVNGGTPTLALNDGGTATYQSGSGTNALVFSYTVLAGQNTADLALAASNAIGLGGATIKDASGNNAVLTGADGFNPAGTLQIDTTRPTVTSITTSPGSGVLNVGSVVTFTVNFSTAVTVAGGIPALRLNDSGAATYQSGSGTSSLVFVYTVAAGQNTADLALAARSAISLNGATIRDAAGNNASLSGANGYNPVGTLQVNTNVPVETPPVVTPPVVTPPVVTPPVVTPPVVTPPTTSVTSVSTSPTSGDLGVGAMVSLTVNFSAAVTVAGGSPTLALNDGGTAVYQSGSGTNSLVFLYNVAAGQNTADLALAASNAIVLGNSTIKGRLRQFRRP